MGGSKSKHIEGKLMDENVYRICEKEVTELEEDARQFPRYAVLLNRVDIPWRACRIANSASVPVPTQLFEQLRKTLDDYNTYKQGKMLKNIALIGETGTGKSSLANLLIGSSSGHFETKADADSVTSKVCTHKHNLFGDPNQEIVQIIDTPGLNDPKMKDEQRISTFLKDFVNLQYITTFILVLNSQNCRFTETHEKMVELFKGVFGLQFLTNLVVVFTHWSMDEATKKRRELEGSTRDKREKEIRSILTKQKESGWEFEIHCFFVDSVCYVNKMEGYESTGTEIRRLMTVAKEMAPYHVILLPVLRERLLVYINETKSFVQYVLENKSTEEVNNQTKELKNDAQELRKRVLNIQKKEAKITPNAEGDDLNERLLEISRLYQAEEQKKYRWDKQLIARISKIRSSMWRKKSQRS